MRRALKWNEEWKDVGSPSHFTSTRQEMIAASWSPLMEQRWRAAASERASFTSNTARVRRQPSVPDYYCHADNNLPCATLTASVCVFCPYSSGCFDFFLLFFPEHPGEGVPDAFCANVESKKLDSDNVRCCTKESVTALGERRRKHNPKTHLTLWLREKKRLLHPIYRW